MSELIRDDVAPPRPHRLGAFYHSVRDFLRDLPSAERRFWFLVVATGAAAGLGAVALVKLLALVQAIAWSPAETLLVAVQGTTRLHRVIVLTLAGLLVSLVMLIMRRPLGGHGTAGIIESIWLKSGHYSLQRALVNGTVAIVVVAMGAPLGREGALIAFGAGFGSWLGTRAKAPADQMRILVACGAAAGIAAAYNVPVGAALFGLEVLLGSFALELLGPIVVSCVTATALSRMLVESHPAYAIPYYRLSGPSELLRVVLISPFLGVFAAVFIRVIEGFAEAGEKVPRKWGIWLPVPAMFIVGVVSCFFPEVLGNGYDAVDRALRNELPLALLLILPFTKLALTASSSGSGVPGGLFTPTLFFGAMLGGAFGALVNSISPTAMPPGAYALVGMAAVLAGTTHAAVSAVLMLFEMTRDYGVILPLLLTSVIAAAVSRGLEPESIYTGVLLRRKVRLPERPRPQWLNETKVDALMSPNFVAVPPTTPFDTALVKLLGLPPGHDLYVTGRDGRYHGVIILDGLRGNLPDREHLGFAIAADFMDSQLKPLTLGAPLADAADRFAKTYLDKVPVVDGSGRLVGVVSKQDLVRRGQF